MTQSESIENLAKSLVEVQKEMPKVQKSETNPFFKSKYAPLNEVVAAALPILTAHGLAITQHITVLDTGDSALETTLMHESGEYMSSIMKLYLNKVDSQGQGSAVTYGRRYALMAIIGMVADEDDDGAKASNNEAENGNLAPKWASNDITPAQLNLIKNLAGENFSGVEEATETKYGKPLTKVSKFQASKIIEALEARQAEISGGDSDDL